MNAILREEDNAGEESGSSSDDGTSSQQKSELGLDKIQKSTKSISLADTEKESGVGSIAGSHLILSQTKLQHVQVRSQRLQNKYSDFAAVQIATPTSKKST